MEIELVPLQENEKERFIKEIQAAFKRQSLKNLATTAKKLFRVKIL